MDEPEEPQEPEALVDEALETAESAEEPEEPLEPPAQDIVDELPVAETPDDGLDRGHGRLDGGAALRRTQHQRRVGGDPLPAGDDPGDGAAPA